MDFQCLNLSMSESDAFDHKKWRNLIRGGKEYSGGGVVAVSEVYFCLIWYQLTWLSWKRLLNEYVVCCCS